MAAISTIWLGFQSPNGTSLSFARQAVFRQLCSVYRWCHFIQVSVA
jgi:hypothetical protein